VRDLELPFLTFALASFDAWLITAKSLFQQVLRRTRYRA